MRNTIAVMLSGMVRHGGFAPYHNGRIHKFVARARGWHSRTGTDGKVNRHFLVQRICLAGQTEVVDSHCWIQGRAFATVMDTENEEQREKIADCWVCFHAVVGSYCTKKGGLGYGIRKVTHLHIVEKDEKHASE